MNSEHIELPGNTIPLHSTTLELDREEGAYINHLKANNVAPLTEPLVEVPDDLQRNLAVTSVDALLNWGQEVRCLAVVLRSGLLRVRDDGERDVPLRYQAASGWRRSELRPDRPT